MAVLVLEFKQKASASARPSLWHLLLRTWRRRSHRRLTHDDLRALSSSLRADLGLRLDELPAEMVRRSL